MTKRNTSIIPALTPLTPLFPYKYMPIRYVRRGEEHVEITGISGAELDLDPSLIPPTDGSEPEFPADATTYASDIPLSPDTLPQVTRKDIDKFTSMISDVGSDPKAIIFAVPSFFGQSKLATYLGYRSIGYTFEESLRMAQWTSKEYWAADSLYDNKISLWEVDNLGLMQKELAKHMTRLAFMRNMMYCFNQDAKILQKIQTSEYGLDMLSDREFKYLQIVRNKYTPTDLLAIEKIISPEDFKDSGEQVINLTWDTREQHVHLEQKLLPEGE